MRLTRLPSRQVEAVAAGDQRIGLLVAARHHGREPLARQLHRQHDVRQRMVALAAEAADQHDVAGAAPHRGIDGKLAVGGVLGRRVDLALHVAVARHQVGRGGIEVADPQFDVEPEDFGMGHAVVGGDDAAARHLASRRGVRRKWPLTRMQNRVITRTFHRTAGARQSKKEPRRGLFLTSSEALLDGRSGVGRRVGRIVGSSMSASCSAHRLAAPATALSMPASVAQLPSSTNLLCCQRLVSFSATSCVAKSGALTKRSTQTTAASFAADSSAASCAIVVAVPPVTHPPQVKPTNIVRAAAPAMLQSSVVLVGW
jgi:hypothetical protein